MAIFQTHGLRGAPLQLELEVAVLSFLSEQEKVLAFQTSGRAWSCWFELAGELKRDWISLLSFEQDRAWEQELSGERWLSWDHGGTSGCSCRHDQSDSS